MDLAAVKAAGVEWEAALADTSASAKARSDQGTALAALIAAQATALTAAQSADKAAAADLAAKAAALAAKRDAFVAAIQAVQVAIPPPA